MAMTITGKGMQVYNALRAGMSSTSQNLLPVGTDGNTHAIGNVLQNNRAVLNEFLETLTNKVTKTIVNSVTFTNPLNRFKRNTDQLGDTIEEVYVALLEEHIYNPQKAETELLKREIPDVKATYHVRNRQSMYKVTIQQEQMLSAFQSWTAFENLVTKIVNSLTTSNERDEYRYTKEIAENAYENGALYQVPVGGLTDEASIKDFIVELRTKVAELEFINRYTPTRVENATPRERQVIMITPRLDAMVDVNVLAAAFNMSNAEFLAKRVIVDSFTDPNLLAVLADENFFIVEEQLRQSGVFHNPQGLYDQHFLHVWQTISYSRYNNAIAFVIEDTSGPDVWVDKPIAVLGAYGVLEETFKIGGDLSTVTAGVADTVGDVTAELNEDFSEVTLTVDPDAIPGSDFIVNVVLTYPSGDVTLQIQGQISRYLNVK